MFASYFFSFAVQSFGWLTCLLTLISMSLCVGVCLSPYPSNPARGTKEITTRWNGITASLACSQYHSTPTPNQFTRKLLQVGWRHHQSIDHFEYEQILSRSLTPAADGCTSNIYQQEKWKRQKTNYMYTMARYTRTSEKAKNKLHDGSIWRFEIAWCYTCYIDRNVRTYWVSTTHKHFTLNAMHDTKPIITCVSTCNWRLFRYMNDQTLNSDQTRLNLANLIQNF